MRILSALGITLAMTATAMAQDYAQYARAEGSQLAKCFGDMLNVAKRHSLREQLVEFLEAGCAQEMQNYRNGLVRHPPPEARDWTDELKRTALGTVFIANMEENAEKLYRKQTVAFCFGDACVTDNYRKCLISPISDELRRKTRPREFDAIIQKKCAPMEAAARAAITVDFSNAQKLQISSQLSSKTRDLITKSLARARKDTVIAYAEELVKIAPSRKSCKVCPEGSCIVIDANATDDDEYNCAIGE